MNAALTLGIAAFTGIFAAASFKQAHELSLVPNPDMNHILWSTTELTMFGTFFTLATAALIGLAVGLHVTSRR